MRTLLKILVLGAMLPVLLAAIAADTAKPDATPPAATPVYPCWDMMQDGKMMPMRAQVNELQNKQPEQ